MPWTVLPQKEPARKYTHEANDRMQGTCRSTIDDVIVQASAVLRRRGSEDAHVVATLIDGAPHCVPCITRITNLDARRVYAALEHLTGNGSTRFASGTCTRCRRTTTTYVAGQPDGRRG